MPLGIVWQAWRECTLYRSSVCQSLGSTCRVVWLPRGNARIPKQARKSSRRTIDQPNVFSAMPRFARRLVSPACLAGIRGSLIDRDRFARCVECGVSCARCGSSALGYWMGTAVEAAASGATPLGLHRWRRRLVNGVVGDVSVCGRPKMHVDHVLCLHHTVVTSVSGRRGPSC